MAKSGGSTSKLSRLAQTTDKWEDGLRGFLYRFRTPLFLGLVTILAFWARTYLWPITSADYNECLHIWLDEIRAGQGFRSIGTQIGNYTAPYHYLMAAMSYIPGLTNLAVIKITSSVADFFMAGAAAYLCLRLCGSKVRAAACYAIALCLPTVFLNSAAWGQCDAMFTTFVLLFAALYLAGRKGWAGFVYGVALAIKLQAIFILPAILILWLCGRFRIRHILSGLLGYFVMFVPAIIGDGSPAPLFRAYSMQTKLHALSSNIYNGASLFTGITADDLEYYGGTLIVTAIITVGIVAFFCWHNKERFTPQSEFLLVAVCALLLPFLLPAMKDRYFYMAEVLCLVYAVCRPRRFAVPVLLQAGSLPAYVYYLTGHKSALGQWPVFFVGAALLLILWDLYRSLAKTPVTKKGG